MISLTTKLKARTLELPEELLEALGLGDGDEVEVRLEGDAITLRPHDDFHDDPDGEALSPKALASIREAVAEALEDVRAGRVTPAFDSMDEFEAYRKTDAYRKLTESE